jgi:non-homologous end joining protein Ku
VVLDALTTKGVWGVATATFSGREHLIVLRAAEKALCIDAMHYTGAARAIGHLGRH